MPAAYGILDQPAPPDVLMRPNAAWGGGYIQVNMPSGGVTSFSTNITTHAWSTPSTIRIPNLL